MRKAKWREIRQAPSVPAAHRIIMRISRAARSTSLARASLALAAPHFGRSTADDTASGRVGASGASSSSAQPTQAQFASQTSVVLIAAIAYAKANGRSLSMAQDYSLHPESRWNTVTRGAYTGRRPAYAPRVFHRAYAAR